MQSVGSSGPQHSEFRIRTEVIVCGAGRRGGHAGASAISPPRGSIRLRGLPICVLPAGRRAQIRQACCAVARPEGGQYAQPARLCSRACSPARIRRAFFDRSARMCFTLAAVNRRNNRCGGVWILRRKGRAVRRARAKIALLRRKAKKQPRARIRADCAHETAKDVRVRFCREYR